MNILVLQLRPRRRIASGIEASARTRLIVLCTVRLVDRRERGGRLELGVRGALEVVWVGCCAWRIAVIG